jgi:Carboxypeptidase regulatory-like domain
MKTAAKFLLALTALFSIAVLPCYAQTVYGSIQGTITDSSGAAIPSAAVTAREATTGIVQKVETNQNGIYVLSSMRPGTYQISAHKQGFGDLLRQGVVVRVGDRISLDMAMSVSSAMSTVEVTAEPPLVRTDDTVVGTVVEEQTIKQLPLSGRTALSLALLAPGVMQSSVSNGTSADSEPRLSGGRPRTNEYTLDGTSITDPRRGSTVIQPNLDAIQEFAVITNGIPAQYGRLAGGIITATLKSGTSQFHGNLFEYYNGNGFGDARNYFAATVPKLVFNQFGGIIGGPIRTKKKLFFFTDYQGTRDRAQSLYNITLPTALEEQGNFSDILGPAVGTDPLGRTVYKNQIFDPSTTRTVNGSVVRDPFPNNTIPKTDWDPAAANVAALYATPTGSGLSQNFYSVQPGGYNHDQADGRVDDQFTASDLAFVRFSYDRTYTIATRPFPTAGGNRGEIDTFYDSSMAWTHTISASVVNDVRVGFLHGQLDRLTPSTNVNSLQIPNLVQEALPTMAPAGYTSIGDSPAFDPTQAEYQVTDNVSMVHGKHILGFGVDFRRFSINDLQLTATSYNFNTLQTSNGTNSNTGNSFASLLLGLSSQYSADTNTGRFYERSNYFAVYGQDEYKLSHTFTANIGLRYDVEQNPNEVDYNGSNFDLASGQIYTMRELGTNRVQHTQWGDFGPRIGFDWSPFGSKTVVRGSYGIFYMPLTGRATSAYDRFPKDQNYLLQSAGITSAVVLSETPPITPSANGYNLIHYHDAPNAHVPYFQQVTFDIQREVPWHVLLQAGFSGGYSRHLWQNVQYNQIPITAVQAAGGGTQSMRPFPNFSNVGYFLEAQSTSYNALLVQAERRYQNGLLLRAAFTWSKFLDVQDDNFSGLYPQDEYNLKAEHGLSLANIPTRLVISSIYDLPFGTGHAFVKSGFAAKIVGEWQAAGIFSIQSGQQVWLRSANNTSGTFSQLMRPNLVGSPFLSKDQRTLKQWFNTAAFPAPAPLNFGDAPKSPNIQGPAWYDLDFNIHRSIPIPLTEQTRFELRGECFNCANHPNFLPPNGQQGSTTFGQITSAGGPRTVQVSGKFWF